MGDSVYSREKRQKKKFGHGEFAQALRNQFDDGDCFSIARRLAAGLHQQYRVAGPPFNPAIFAEHLGISWQMRDDIEAEGVLAKDVALHRYTFSGRDEEIHGALITHPDVGDRILLRKVDGLPSSLRRLRFTFAHEIGHFILRKRVTPAIRTFHGCDAEEETLCNVFAEELLMPSDRIREELVYRVRPDNLIDIKNRYEVSLQALLTRVASFFCGNLVGVIWIKEPGRPLRAAWATTKDFTRIVFCDTGATPVERAFRATRVQEGSCEVLLNGHPSHWLVSAMQLPNSEACKVLSVFTRVAKGSGRRGPCYPVELYKAGPLP
jgi:hypothetical protein